MCPTGPAHKCHVLVLIAFSFTKRGCDYLHGLPLARKPLTHAKSGDQ